MPRDARRRGAASGAALAAAPRSYAPAVGGLWRVLTLAGFVAALAGTPAAAQLPPIGPQPPPEEGEEPPRDPPPVTPTPDPGPDWPSQLGDASARRWSGDSSVRPPFELRWRASFGELTARVLLVSGGTVVAGVGEDNTGHIHRVEAFDAATGARLWELPVSGLSDGSIVIAAGRVVLGGGDRITRGYDLRSGAEVWSVETGSAYTLTPSGDDVFFWSSSWDGGTRSAALVALDAAAGGIRWRAPEESPSGTYGRILVSGDRLFHPLDCSTYAYDRRDGAELWSQSEGCSGGGQTNTALAGTNVIAYRSVLDMGDGRRLPDALPPPGVIAGGRVIGGAGEDSVHAVELGTNRELWRRRLPDTRSPAVATVAGDLAFVGGDYGMFVLDAATGHELWSGSVADGHPAVAAGGLLLVRQEHGLVALGPVAGNPPEVTLRPRFGVIEYGRRLRLKATIGYGRDVRLGVPATLLADPYPFGALRARRSAVATRFGEAAFVERPSRATAYRVDAQGGRSRTVVAVVVPRFRVRILRESPSSALVRVTVRVPRRVRARGRTIGIYHLRRARRTYVRLGSARLRGGRGRYAATFTVRRPRLRGRDVVLPCVRGLVRYGLGIGDRFERRCGAARIRNRAAARAARASRGTRWPPATP
jgi:outer membrane protein assembly factor BamB